MLERERRASCGGGVVTPEPEPAHAAEHARIIERCASPSWFQHLLDCVTVRTADEPMYRSGPQLIRARCEKSVPIHKLNSGVEQAQRKVQRRGPVVLTAKVHAASPRVILLPRSEARNRNDWRSGEPRRAFPPQWQRVRVLHNEQRPQRRHRPARD